MLKVYRTRVAKLVVAMLFVSYGFSFPFQTVSAITPNNLKGLTLSPLRTELALAPGTSLDDSLEITNSTDKPMTVNFSAEEFSVINQQYDYAFTQDSDVTKWVKFTSSEVNLAAGDSQKVAYSVGLPLSAEPGGRYISLFASTSANTVDSSIASRQRVASLLYITVEGNVTRKGEILSISSPSITASGVEQISFQLRNSGSTHYRNKYELKVASLFGSIEQSISGNALILPGSVRRITEQLPMPFWPGVYKLQMQIGLGDNPLHAEERLIIYIPVWFALVVILGTGGLYIYRKTRKIKSSAEQQYTK
jgi:hypothetical protein